MSDHEDISFDTGYSTPVPELDDHTNQAASVQKPRSRRGTVDTMYSTMAKNVASPDLGVVNDKLQTSQAAKAKGELGCQSISVRSKSNLQDVLSYYLDIIPASSPASLAESSISPAAKKVLPVCSCALRPMGSCVLEDDSM